MQYFYLSHAIISQGDNLRSWHLKVRSELPTTQANRKISRFTLRRNLIDESFHSRLVYHKTLRAYKFFSIDFGKLLKFWSNNQVTFGAHDGWTGRVNTQYRYVIWITKTTVKTLFNYSTSASMENGYMLKTHKMSLKLLTARKTFNKIALPDAQSCEKTATVPPGS